MFRFLARLPPTADKRLSPAPAIPYRRASAHVGNERLVTRRRAMAAASGVARHSTRNKDIDKVFFGNWSVRTSDGVRAEGIESALKALTPAIVELGTGRNVLIDTTVLLSTIERMPTGKAENDTDALTALCKAVGSALCTSLAIVYINFDANRDGGAQHVVVNTSANLFAVLEKSGGMYTLRGAVPPDGGPVSYVFPMANLRRREHAAA